MAQLSSEFIQYLAEVELISEDQYRLLPLEKREPIYLRYKKIQNQGK